MFVVVEFECFKGFFRFLLSQQLPTVLVYFCHGAERKGVLHRSVGLCGLALKAQDLRLGGKGLEILVPDEGGADRCIGPGKSFIQIGIVLDAELGGLHIGIPGEALIATELTAERFQLGLYVIDLHFERDAQFFPFQGNCRGVFLLIYELVP